MMYALGDTSPQLFGDGHFIAPTCSIIGDVQLKASTSVWFGAVIRADNTPIVIGEGSNVQDGAVLHSDEGSPLTVHSKVTIGHNATIHGCTLHDCVLVGIGATILNGAIVGEGSIVGANALVPEGMVIPPNSLVLGVPAKVVKTLANDTSLVLKAGAEHYVDNAQRFNKELKEIENAN